MMLRFSFLPLREAHQKKVTFIAGDFIVRIFPIVTALHTMAADKIKALREQNGYTQSDLAKKLGITRSSVNAWEMGISVPSTQYIVELASIFKGYTA